MTNCMSGVLHHRAAAGGRVIFSVHLTLISIHKVNIRHSFPLVVHFGNGNQLYCLSLEQEWKIQINDLFFILNQIKENTTYTNNYIRTCCKTREVWAYLAWCSFTKRSEACATEASGKPKTGYNYSKDAHSYFPSFIIQKYIPMIQLYM